MALTTIACTIDENGITAPTFADVLAYWQDKFRAIYGDDIYLENDSADGQMLGVLTAAIDDGNQTTIAVHNNFSPQSAVGVGLSQVVKVNGLRRLIPSRSTVAVRIVGVAGTVITGGLLADTLGTQWLLDDTTIPPAGEVIATATCQTDGAVALADATVLTIITPTPGWQSATTSAAATPGAPVESDAALRQRQSISTAQPAQTPLPAITAAVANLSGVQRVRPYENDTGATDGHGIPAHSISLVVKGGDAVDIATAIAAKKAPGTGTYGTTSEVVIDTMGVPNTIRYYVESDISVLLSVDLQALTGYLSTTGDAIKAAVAAYISAQPAGETLYLNRLWAPLSLAGDTAVTATGIDRSQLNAMATTYNLGQVTQARSDMTVTGGPVVAGATSMTLVNIGGITAGNTLSFTLDDDSAFGCVASNIAGNVLTFTPAVPVGRSIANGTLVYTNANLAFAFYEASVCTTDDVTLTVF